MEICKIDISINDKISKYEAFIMEQTQCPICGTELEFYFEKLAPQMTIIEKTCCPACGISAKAKSHQLH
jgi:hypothetical protein